MNLHGNFAGMWRQLIKPARTHITCARTCPRATLSIFEPPLISRNRDRDRTRPIEFGIQTARLCQIAVRAGELRGLKNNILVERRSTGNAGGDRWGPTGVGYHGMRLKLTLNDFSTLLPYGARESLWCGRDGFWISMFLIRNIRFSAIFHAPRSTVDARRASLWDFINSTSPRRREWKRERERAVDKKGEKGRGCTHHVLKGDPHFASKSTAEHYPGSIFSRTIMPDVGDWGGRFKFTS